VEQLEPAVIALAIRSVFRNVASETDAQAAIDVFGPMLSAHGEIGWFSAGPYHRYPETMSFVCTMFLRERDADAIPFLLDSLSPASSWYAIGDDDVTEEWVWHNVEGARVGDTTVEWLHVYTIDPDHDGDPTRGMVDEYRCVWLRAPSHRAEKPFAWDVFIAGEDATPPEWMREVSTDARFVNVDPDGNVDALAGTNEIELAPDFYEDAGEEPAEAGEIDEAGDEEPAGEAEVPE